MQSTTEPPTTHEQPQATQAAHDAGRALWVLGPLPPPVTGMTLLTSAILQALESAGCVRSFNWSPGLPRRSLWMRLRRNARMLRSVAMLLARGRVRNERLYMVANSYSGLYSTALVVFVAARLGYTIYLHHHVYFYIDEYDSRMAWIVRRLRPRDVHVVHCAKMVDDFRNRYPTTSGFQIVYPSIVVDEIGQPRPAARQPLRLGLLSNLSAAKGLSDVIATFSALVDRQRDVTLTLAGPVSSSDSQRLIDETIANYPGRVRNIGPLYGDDKRRFFNDIDAFLFPTKSESWGLVLNEALAAGVPVITFDRGCTSLVVGEEAGLLIDRGALFAELAALQVERWIDDNDLYRRTSQAAIAQAERLHDDGQRTLDDFVRHMFSPLPPALSNA
ncbi:MAG: glycosyltransferase family 4 protein [Planctomycetes bacterium]|nr:glycosyltransferase family 4 protein [Planctomycetota bacterium]